MAARSVEAITLRDGAVESRVLARPDGKPGIVIEVRVGDAVGCLELDEGLTYDYRTAITRTLKASGAADEPEASAKGAKK